MTDGQNGNVSGVLSRRAEIGGGIQQENSEELPFKTDHALPIIAPFGRDVTVVDEEWGYLPSRRDGAVLVAAVEVGAKPVPSDSRVRHADLGGQLP